MEVLGGWNNICNSSSFSGEECRDKTVSESLGLARFGDSVCALVGLALCLHLLHTFFRHRFNEPPAFSLIDGELLHDCEALALALQVSACGAVLASKLTGDLAIVARKPL